MTFTLIPVKGKPNSTQRVVLSGKVYTLGLRWNTREGYWYLSLEDSEGVLLAPTKVIPGFPLTRSLRGPRKPPGLLTALDRSGHMGPPGLNDFGTRVVLTYNG